MMIISSPHYSLDTLIERLAEENNQPAKDVAAAICGAILDGSLSITSRFAGEYSGLYSEKERGLERLPISAKGHLRDVSEFRTAPQSRLDFKHIFIGREDFAAWQTTANRPLPVFWFGTQDRATTATSTQPKRQYNKLATSDRNELILACYMKVSEQAKRDGSTLTVQQLCTKVLDEMPELKQGDHPLSAASVKRIFYSMKCSAN